MVNDTGMQNSKWEICLAAGDVAVFFAAIPILLLWHLQLGQSPQFFPGGRDVAVLVLLGVNLLVIYISDLYDKYKDYRDFENISRIIFAVWIGMVLGGLVIRFSTHLYLHRSFIEWHALFFSGLLIFWRYLFSALALPQRLKRRVLIVGAGDSGRRILETIQDRPNSGLELIGFVDDDPQKAGQRLGGVPVLGTSDALTDLIERHKIELVVHRHHPGKIAETAENPEPPVVQSLRSWWICPPCMNIWPRKSPWIISPITGCFSTVSIRANIITAISSVSWTWPWRLSACCWPRRSSLHCPGH